MNCPYGNDNLVKQGSVLAILPSGCIINTQLLKKGVCKKSPKKVEDKKS